MGFILMGDFLLLSYTHSSPSLADSNLSVSLSKGERSPKDAGKTGAATGDGGRHTFGIHVFCCFPQSEGHSWEDFL